MKTNLKNRPQSPEEYYRLTEKWFEDFEKELREKLAIAERNAKRWRENFKRSTTKEKDAWYKEAAEEWDLLASQLNEILGEG